MKLTFGTLLFTSALDRPDLLAGPVKTALEQWSGHTLVSQILVCEIDPKFSDTDAFCAEFQVDPAETANCLIVEGRRAGAITPAGCLVPAHARADINGLIRRRLGARQTSMASREFAVDASGQEYGSITILGLPGGWPLLIDQSLLEVSRLVIGGGLRRSKLLIPGTALTEISGAVILDTLTKP